MNIDHLSHSIPAQGKLLWVIEEAGIIHPEVIRPHANRSTILCNRIDIQHAYQQVGKSLASDFELDEGHFEAVIFYVSKERLLSNFVIAASTGWLNKTGSLILLGKKNEGIKNYTNKLTSKRALKKHGDLYLGEYYPPDSNAVEVNKYQQEIQLNDGRQATMLSKPGIFSWKKIDQGSTFLIDTLIKHKIDLRDHSVLDLGCGYGYLAIFASLQGARWVTATDNNITATMLCKKNFELHKVRGEVLAMDCGEYLKKEYQIILCNPPFHKGKNIETTLSERFITTAARLLCQHGKAYFVVNSFIPLERIAEPYFRRIILLEKNPQYKIVQFG